MMNNNAATWARAAGSQGRIPVTPPVVPLPGPNVSANAGLGDLRPPPPKAGLNEAGGAKTGLSNFVHSTLMGAFGMSPKSNQPFNLNTWFNNKMASQKAAAPAPAAPAPNKYDRASTLMGIGSDLLK